jgi:hypothetical protein
LEAAPLSFCFVTSSTANDSSSTIVRDRKRSSRNESNRRTETDRGSHAETKKEGEPPSGTIARRAIFPLDRQQQQPPYVSLKEEEEKKSTENKGTSTL